MERNDEVPGPDPTELALSTLLAIWRVRRARRQARRVHRSRPRIEGHLAPPSLTNSMRKRVQRSHHERAVSSKEEHELQRVAVPAASAE